MPTTHVSPVTVALPTLGCKVNRYDSDTLARALAALGYTIVPAGQAADVYIVNTCTVTGGADAKSRKTLRRALKLNEQAILIVTGCYASLAPGTFAEMAGVDAVVPIEEQHRIPALIRALKPPGEAAMGQSTPRGLIASIERTRATVKVQDGCNLRCAFCAVTLARGNVRSRPIGQILGELGGVVAMGINEVVLTGIRLDAYGLDHGSTLAELISATRVLDLQRLRVSSLEPIGIHAALISAMAEHPALCHHFHICLQSGDDGVLRAMRRGYTAGRFRRVIGSIRARIPDAEFTTDIIVGFPGETEDAFHNTCTLIEDIGFLKLHIFKFSPRAGTRAATMSLQISEVVKEERSQQLFALQHSLFQRYAERQIGTIASILVERTGAQGNGLTPQYVRVLAPFPAASVGTIQTVRITGYGDEYLRGELALPVDCAARGGEE